VALGSYWDEEGNELWSSEVAVYVPPGTLVTGPDGARYLAVKVRATEVIDGPKERLRITLRALGTRN
jgi:hypothetical protein